VPTPVTPGRSVSATGASPTPAEPLGTGSASTPFGEADTVAISTEARQRQARAEDSALEDRRDEEPEPGELSESEQDLVDRLKDRDREVRAHEQAHLRAAGSLAQGGPKYDYQTGPDGKRYAVGGSVSIDTSPVPGDPEATRDKARQIKRAALAPAEPSSTDRSVAAKADRLKVRADREIQQERLEESRAAAAERSAEPEETAAYTAGGAGIGAEEDIPAGSLLSLSA